MSVMEMMYGKKHKQTGDRHRTFRLERGFPFMRNGKFVTANPRWKGLRLFSHTTENAPTYQTSSPGVEITWPSPPV